MYFNKNYSKAPASRYPNKYQKPQTRLGKRWYIDASLPKSVPFLGGSSFKAGSGTLTKRSIQNIVRQTVLENKQKIVDGSGQVNMTHNTLYTFNPFANIPVGTGDASRTSDTIHIKNVNIRAILNDQNNVVKDKQVVFRFLWIKSSLEYLSGLDTFTAGVGLTDYTVQGSSSTLLAHNDSDKCQILMDKTITLDPVQMMGVATPFNITQQRFIDLSLPLPAGGLKMQYKTATSNYGKNFNYYLVGSAYHYNAVSGVTVLGGTIFNSLVDFVDGQ